VPDTVFDATAVIWDFLSQQSLGDRLRAPSSPAVTTELLPAIAAPSQAPEETPVPAASPLVPAAP